MAITSKPVCEHTHEPMVAHCEAHVKTRPDGRVLVHPLTGGPSGGFLPTDLQSAYSLPTSGAGGATVAIVEAYDNPSLEADLAVYRTQMGQAACTTANGCFTKVNQTGQVCVTDGGANCPTTNSAWGSSATLDVQALSAVCPDCNILVVEATSASTANLFTALQYAAGHAVAVSIDAALTEYAGEVADETTYFSGISGVGIFAPSGDGEQGQVEEYGVSFPAASQYVTAVGGTTLQQGGTDAGARGWEEWTWNDAVNGIGTGSGCSQYISKPVWQHDNGCTKRTANDVAMVADPTTGLAIYDSISGGWIIAGGTSSASAMMAGVSALTGHAAANASLSYQLSSDFTDIVSGVNGTCGGSYLCGAKAGYDGPTGNGVPIGTALATPCTPSTCTSESAQCGSPLNGCGDLLSCGTCIEAGSQYTCNSSYQCVDLVPPAGTVTIGVPTPDAGAGTFYSTGGTTPTLYTSSLEVGLTLSATDQAGVSQMCISNSTTCTAWQTYATSVPQWTLVGGTGQKTVYAFFKSGSDASDSVAQAATANVTLDTTAPTNPTNLTAAGQGTHASPADAIQLNWTASTDTASGVAGYEVFVSTTGTPASCPTSIDSDAGLSAIYVGTNTTFTQTGLSNLTQYYYYRVCAYDNVGNLSSGSTVSAHPDPDSTPPNNPDGGLLPAVVINGGATITNNQFVTLSMEVADPNYSTAQLTMCVSNSGPCSNYVAYAATVTNYQLALCSGGQQCTGTKTVYVTFNDPSNNPVTVSSSIELDITNPGVPTLTAVGSATGPGPTTGQVALSWTPASDPNDTNPPPVQYTLVGSPNGPPTSCANNADAGTSILTGPFSALPDAGNLNFTQTGLTAGDTYYYMVCAVDSVGNMSSSSASARPAATYLLPTGSLLINGTASGGSVGQLGVTLTLTGNPQTVAVDGGATVPNAISEYCVSNTPGSCSPWSAYTGAGMTVPWNLTTGNGLKTVYAYYEDEYGNVQTTPDTATITLNIIGPSPAVTIQPAAGNSFTTLADGGIDTTTPNIDLLLSVSGGSGGPYSYCISSVGPCSNFAAFTPEAGTSISLPYTIPACSGGQQCTGTKTVYLTAKDSAGNTNTASASIELDLSAPSVPVLTATGSATGPGATTGQVALSWTMSSDPVAGLKYYTLVGNPNAAPTSCAASGSTTILYGGTAGATATTFTQTGLTAGATYYYMVCATDNVGYTSAGGSASARPAATYFPPYGTVQINSGASSTGTTDVTLTLTGTAQTVAVDGGPTVPNAITQYCASNTPTGSCSPWNTYTGGGMTAPFILTSGNGSKTVYVYYRDEYNNVQTVPSTASITLAIVGPTVGLVINTGDGGTYTDNPNVVLDITITEVGGLDPTGPFKYCISNTGVCTPATTFIADAGANTVSIPYTIPVCSGGQECTGLKTITVTANDTNLNANSASAQVTLDITNPNQATNFVATGSHNQVALTWTAATDPIVAIQGYNLVKSSTGPLTSCAVTSGVTQLLGALDAGANVTSYTDNAVTDGTTYYYQLCPVDVVGNTTSGDSASARPAPTYNPPTGTSIALNGTDTPFTGPSNLVPSLSLTAFTPNPVPVDGGTVPNSVASMCISNTAACSNWIPFVNTYFGPSGTGWPVAGGTGVKTVYAAFRDQYNNVSSTVSNTITLDQTPPTNATTFTAAGGNGTVTLTWGGASDANSGLASYTLAYSTIPLTSCTLPSGDAGAPITITTGFGPGSTGTSVSVANGATYYFQLCPVDNVGNTTTGVSASALATPDPFPPTGSIIVANSQDGGTAFTNSTTVQLDLTAAIGDAGAGLDPGGDQITHMCVSNTSTCTNFSTAFASTYPAPGWNLPNGDGTKTVYAYFRDTFNNTSTVKTGSITLDTTAPTGPTTITPVENTAGNPASVGLSWPAASDATSGVSGYTVVRSSTTSMANCNGGSGISTLQTNGAGLSFNDSSVAYDTLYFYRVCPVDNAGNVGTGFAVTAEPKFGYTDPGLSFTVNGFASGSVQTSGATVTLLLSFNGNTDTAPSYFYCMSNAPCTPTTSSPTFSGSINNNAWPIPNCTGGQQCSGLKTFYAAVLDSYGNTTSMSATMTLDLQAPNNPSSFTATPNAPTNDAGGAQVTLNWTAASEPGALSGAGITVTGYTLVRSSTVSLSNCNSGSGVTVLVPHNTPYASFPATYVDNTVVFGTTYSYQLCATDSAGVTNTGISATTEPAPEYTDPTPQPTLPDGGLDTLAITGTGFASGYTTSTSVTVNPDATFASSLLDSGVPNDMCISNTPTCTSWVPYATSQAWTIANGDGVHTVYARYRDEWGNVSAASQFGQITLDTTAPTNPGSLAIDQSLTVGGSPGSIGLEWTPSADTGSGLHNYTIVSSSTGQPASCNASTAGVPIVTMSGTPTCTSSLCTVQITGLTDSLNGTQLGIYYFQVCANDNAGNQSTGSGVSGVPTSDFTPPTAQLSVSSPTTGFTNTTTIRLNVNAVANGSPVTQECLSNTATTAAACTPWVGYTHTANRAWALPAGDGTKTIHAYYRDEFYNTSGTTASIVLDQTAPTGGSTTASLSGTTVNVNWSGFADATSGIASYLVLESTSAITSCTPGGGVNLTTVGAATATYPETGLAAGTYFFAVCAEDNAGNISPVRAASGSVTVP